MSASHIYLLICMNLIKKIIIIIKKNDLKQYSLLDISYHSPRHLFAWHCFDIVKRNDIPVIPGISWKLKVYGQEGIKNSKIEHLALLTLKNLVKKTWYYIKIKPYSWMKIAWRNYNRTFIKRSLREMARWTFKTGWPFVKVFTDWGYY